MSFICCWVKLTPQIQMFRHEGIAEFGIGKEEPEHLWNSLMRQLLLEDLLKKDIEEYGVLKLTKKGEDFLKKPRSFKIVLNNLFEEANADDEEEGTEAAGTTATDEKLFELLKDLRQKEAKKKALPPFVIFLESSRLQDMATLYPHDGAGTGKMPGRQQGQGPSLWQAVYRAHRRYVEENDIEKPDDFVMKSVVNKSVNKVYIIQQVDKKIPLETIAKNKDLRLDALLEDMETIAASGTKLNLNYAVDEMLDEYEQDEIIDYFKSCETSSLQVAQQELSEGNFTWEQLKMMRIKFLSEYGM
jgi:ATP-dependent DNA helicase RecQ